MLPITPQSGNLVPSSRAATELRRMEQRSSASGSGAHELGGSGQRRAAVACKVCHSRKVRCNISLNGRPCSNCKRDGHPCVPHAPQRRKTRPLKGAANPCVVGCETAVDEAMTLNNQGAADAISSDHRNDDPLRIVPTEDLPSAPEQSSPSSTLEEDCRSNIEGYKSIFGGVRPQGSRVVLFMGEAINLHTTCTRIQN